MEDVTGADPKRKGLTEEAIWLARALASLTPSEPEPKGLLALIALLRARRRPRRTSSGAYIPLDQQDVGQWSRPMIAEAEALLENSARAKQLGRFQLEAAIQSVHVERRLRERTARRRSCTSTHFCRRSFPTIGNNVAYRRGPCRNGNADVALSRLDLLREACRDYQPYWAHARMSFTVSGIPPRPAMPIGRPRALTEDQAVRKLLLAAMTALPEVKCHTASPRASWGNKHLGHSAR